MRSIALISLLALMAAGSGCKSAYYGFWSKLGYEKRDILVGKVEDARKEQEGAKEEFKTTLDRFTEVTHYEGGELEAKYKKLSSAYDDCESRAKGVHKSIADVESVAGDLFGEWEKEIGEYDSAELKKSSEQKLQETKDRYRTLVTAMKKSESRMQPVLTAFKDQVLFLKHNLNASALASLQETAAGIDADVTQLVKDMEASIDEANAFVEQMK